MDTIINDIDVELQSHLKSNLNNHIWSFNNGQEQSVQTMEHGQVVDLYNNLLRGKFTVLYQEEWLSILQAKMSHIL